MEEIGRSGSIEFAPYNQVFQQLLDPNSLRQKSPGHQRGAGSARGLAAISGRGEGPRDPKPVLAQNAADLIGAVRSAMARSPAPLIVAFCPNSPG